MRVAGTVLGQGLWWACAAWERADQPGTRGHLFSEQGLLDLRLHGYPCEAEMPIYPRAQRRTKPA